MGCDLTSKLFTTVVGGQPAWGLKMSRLETEWCACYYRKDIGMNSRYGDSDSRAGAVEMTVMIAQL